MKKLYIILSFCFIFCICNISCFAAATNSYDVYGSKTGSYRKQGNTINAYDRYGSKTGS